MNLYVSTGPISPVERLEITKKIWMLNEVTREEAEQILHDKEPGNFLVRGSKLDDHILVLSVKLGSRHGSIVEHFIIIVNSGRVLLEDSDLQFENITSLVFHYSYVCDELPEKLRLPAILRTIESFQTLSSLSLLGKKFWNYPMARSNMNVNQRNKTSDIAAPPVQSCNAGLKGCNLIKPGTKLVTTPHLHPRKISDLSPSDKRKLSAINSPNCSPKSHRRKSDPLSIILNIAGPSLQPRQTLNIETKDKVLRQRKQSVFNDRLDIVANNVKSMNSALNGVEDTDVLNKMIEETAGSYIQRKQNSTLGMHKNGQSSDSVSLTSVGGISRNCVHKFHNTCQYEDKSNSKYDSNEDDTYSEPIDKINNTNNTKMELYSSPIYSSIAEVPDLIKEHSPRHNMSNLDLRRLRYSDGNINNSHRNVNSDIFNEDNAKKKYTRGRKFSLGPMIRKLSTSKLSESDNLAKQSNLQQEKKISNALSRLFGNDSLISKHVFGHSYQTDSSSWEYLNQDVDDVIINIKNPLTSEKNISNSLKHKPELIHTDSSDSVYESEFDSKTSTLDSLNLYSTNQEKNAYKSQLCTDFT